MGIKRERLERRSRNSWREGDDGEQEGCSKSKMREEMQNRGTERCKRKGWCGRRTDQKGENWRYSYGAGFPIQ